MTLNQARFEAQRLANALEKPINILRYRDDYYPLLDGEKTRISGEIVAAVAPSWWLERMTR